MITPEEQVYISNMFCDAFLDGQLDCRAGIKHKDKSAAYNRGYATEYEAEQVQDAMGVKE